MPPSARSTTWLRGLCSLYTGIGLSRGRCNSSGIHDVPILHSAIRIIVKATEWRILARTVGMHTDRVGYGGGWRCPGSTTCCATTTGPSVDMPSAIQAMSRRYEFWKTPEDLQNAVDRMLGRATWQLYAHEAERALTSCAVTRLYSISLSVGFLDKSLRSIGLCGSSWYPWCRGSNVWTYADGPLDSFRVPYVELQLSNRT